MYQFKIEGNYLYEVMNTSMLNLRLYKYKHGSLRFCSSMYIRKGIFSFVGLVVNQTAVDIQRIHKLGVKKIAVTSLPPLGCVPEITISSSYKAKTCLLKACWAAADAHELLFASFPCILQAAHQRNQCNLSPKALISTCCLLST